MKIDNQSDTVSGCQTCEIFKRKNLCRACAKRLKERLLKELERR
jgi:recombinational DNA repair protein RecR